jgi:hypothetical protein
VEDVEGLQDGLQLHAVLPRVHAQVHPVFSENFEH